VETHGRSETAALLEGLPQLPRATCRTAAATLPEFDLDAALARKACGAAGGRAGALQRARLAPPQALAGRAELLAAGIDVWSTLNVQHLESLNGTVGAITGIRVHETVPDGVLDEADEVILVDVTPDELLRG
jgi:two-component system sensor histidine kinase KdpD